MLLGQEPAAIDDGPPPASNQVRLVAIDAATLREMLRFPDGAVIEGCYTDLRQLEPHVVLRVRHADFSPVGGGLVVPFVKPQYAVRTEGDCREVEFVAWDPSESF